MLVLENEMKMKQFANSNGKIKKSERDRDR